jgi:hypothetical protein
MQWWHKGFIVPLKHAALSVRIRMHSDRTCMARTLITCVMYVGLILGVCGGGRGAAAPCERCLRLRTLSPEKIISEKSNYIEILSPMAQIKV